MRHVALGVVGTLGLFLFGCAPAEPASQTQQKLGTISSHIFHGTPDTTHSAVVALLSDQSECSGTIIKVSGNTGYVLTAAHCVPANDQPKWAVQANDYNDQNATVYTVTGTKAHPSYNGDTYDFGMVTITGVGPETPVLPAMTKDIDNLKVGSPVDFVGYGLTENDNPNSQNVNSLRRQFMGSIDGEVTTLQLKYSQTTGGPCEGDSGGPSLSTVGGKEYVSGVTSYGDQACVQYGVSGRVSGVYDSFIAPYINGSSPPPQTCQECSQSVTSGMGACIKQVTACQNDTDCSALNQCFNNCGANDQACFQTCQTQHQAGAQLYNNIDSCICGTGCPTECATECGGGGAGGAGGAGGSGQGGSPGTADCTDGGTNYGAPGQATCTTCQQTEFGANGCCATEAAACSANMACGALNTCLQACAAGDQACQQQCATANPNGVSDFNNIITCTFGDGSSTNGACGVACGQPSTGGGGNGGAGGSGQGGSTGTADCTDGGANYGAPGQATCTTCQQTEFGANGCCAQESMACGSNPDCLALNKCIGTCSDQTCANGCATANPKGVADFNAITTCAFGDGSTSNGACGVACGQPSTGDAGAGGSGQGGSAAGGTSSTGGSSPFGGGGKSTGTGGTAAGGSSPFGGGGTSPFGGGGTSTGGTAASGAAGKAAAGTSSTAGGSTGNAGGSTGDSAGSTGDAGGNTDTPSTTPQDSSSSSGCSVATPRNEAGGLSASLLLGFAALLGAGRRRRNRG